MQLIYGDRKQTSTCLNGWVKAKRGEMKSLSHVQLCDPMDYSLQGSSVHRIYQARILEWLAISFSRGSSQPRDWTWVSCIAGRLLTGWVRREVQKSESDSVLFGSLWLLQARILEWVAFSLLQWIFPTQESNWGLLHCRRILYQLSYQGNPNKGREGWITKGYEATFRVDGNIDYSDGSMGLYRLQISKSYNLNMCSLLYINHTSI